VTDTRGTSVAQQRPPVIRVMIMSEVRLYREGLAHVLAAQPQLNIVEAAANDVFASLRAEQPDVVLADSTIVRTTDLVARAADARVRIVAFAVAEDDEDEVLACAEAGVAGFVARDATMDELLTTLRTAVRGELCCSPRIASLVVRRVASLACSAPRRRENLTLTRREAEIVSLIDAGFSNKQIAKRLRIEMATVKNHVHHLLEKLKVHRRGEAAAIVRGDARRHRIGNK
jgi:two-component system, NarL family, nitrate/nitrite response regulator NarL